MAVAPLGALIDAGYDIALVVSRADARRGRGTALTPSPVKAEALDRGVPVTDTIDDVVEVGAELGVVVAYGRIIRPPVLDRVPMVNLHFSLLPRWRGAAPVERAILAGDPETGVCVMRLEEGLDTGPVFASERTPIAPDETAGELRDRLVVLGTDLLVRTLPSVETTMPIPQSGVATHAAKLTVEEFRIDPAAAVADLTRLVRAGNPRPGAWALVEGRRLKVLRAHVQAGDERGPAMATTPGPAPAASSSASLSGPGRVERGGGLVTGDGVLVLDEVQREGKAAMSGAAWLAGWRSTHGAAQPVFERR